MKKNKRSKLALKSESVRVLSGTRLRFAMGGGSNTYASPQGGWCSSLGESITCSAQTCFLDSADACNSAYGC